MFYRLRDGFQRSRFNFLRRDILRSAPLQMRDADLSIVSQVSHRDVVMYLIAIKSIYRLLGGGKIVILDDGSLTSGDRDHLMRHLPSVRIATFDDVNIAHTPHGGCWERLLLIADLVRDSYVLQVDSDSLTLRDISEVLNHAADNRSFTLLGAGSFPAVESMLDACARARRSKPRNTEPQGVAERSLDRFPDCAKRKYVRGNAAFAGFARGSFSKTDVEYFSQQMEAICGHEIWHTWGSEQVTSNLVIANCGEAAVLPSPKYVSYYALRSIDYAQSSFLHFMGTHRFENGCYSALAGHVIQQLIEVANEDGEVELRSELRTEGSSSTVSRRSLET